MVLLLSQAKARAEANAADTCGRGGTSGEDRGGRGKGRDMEGGGGRECVVDKDGLQGRGEEGGGQCGNMG